MHGRSLNSTEFASSRSECNRCNRGASERPFSSLLPLPSGPPRRGYGGDRCPHAALVAASPRAAPHRRCLHKSAFSCLVGADRMARTTGELGLHAARNQQRLRQGSDTGHSRVEVASIGRAAAAFGLADLVEISAFGSGAVFHPPRKPRPTSWGYAMQEEEPIPSEKSKGARWRPWQASAHWNGGASRVHFTCGPRHTLITPPSHARVRGQICELAVSSTEEDAL